METQMQSPLRHRLEVFAAAQKLYAPACLILGLLLSAVLYLKVSTGIAAAYLVAVLVTQGLDIIAYSPFRKKNRAATPSLKELLLCVSATLAAVTTFGSAAPFLWATGAPMAQLSAALLIHGTLFCLTLQMAGLRRLFLLASLPMLAYLVSFPLLSATGPHPLSGNDLTTYIIVNLCLLGAVALAYHRNDRNSNLLFQALESAREERRLSAQSQRRIETILSSEPECVKTMDCEGVVQYMNPAGLTMVEADDESCVVGVSALELVNADYHDVFRQALEATLKGQVSQCQFEITGLGGTRRWMDQVSVLMQDPSGENKDEILAVTRDITDNVRTMKELSVQIQKAEAANRAKSDFLANMSHEVRTPLNGVLGMAQLLSSQEQDPRRKEYLDIILDSGQSLLSIVDDVLDLSKIEAGHVVLTADVVNLTDKMERLVELWKPKAEEKKVNLTLEVDTSVPPHLTFDSLRVRQCVSNLISNAVKFTENGTVAVRVDANLDKDGSGIVTIAVADTGIGITREHLETLFDPFVQADGSTTRLYGGTGLGLTISRNLARLMQGDITAVSQPGTGSTFTMTFAASAAAADPAVVEPKGSDFNVTDQLSGLKILVVDDNATNRKVIGKFLSDQAAVAVEADNGEEALAILAGGEAFDLIYLDIHMPVMNGPAMMEALRQSDLPSRLTPVIAITADAMEGQRDAFLEQGFDACVAKPIDFSDLLDLSLSLTNRTSSSAVA